MEISILEALELINQSEVVAVPTETVYGLAASLFKPAGIEKIFALKGRPANNPLIIHVADKNEILPYLLDPDPNFFKLADAFWPGPLTLVLPIIEDKVPAKARAHLTTAAFRIPNHPLAIELLKLTGPLVMPSANISGRPSATNRQHVETDFGIDFPVLDGGFCIKGLESTILYQDPTDAANPIKIIRQGALSQEDLFKVIGIHAEIILPKNNESPLCPGQLYRHYAPKAKLILTTTIPDNYKGVIVGYENRKYPLESMLYSLGDSSKPESISKNLYHVLRKLDEMHVKEALVDINIPNINLFATILERLKKASS